MICASRSRVHNALFPVGFEAKERSRRNLDIVYYVPLDRGECLGLALQLARFLPGMWPNIPL